MQVSTLTRALDAYPGLLYDLETKPTKRERKLAKRQIQDLERELGRFVLSYVESQNCPVVLFDEIWDNTELVGNAKAVYEYLTGNLLKNGCKLERNTISFGKKTLTMRISEAIFWDDTVYDGCKSLSYTHIMYSEQTKALAHTFYEWCK